MRWTHERRWPAYGVVLIAALAGAVRTHGQCQTTRPTYSSFLYLATWPDNERPGWHNEAEGLAHDDDHWYITQNSAIWRIPVTHDLSQDASSFPHRGLSSYPELSGFTHFGDPDCYRTSDTAPHVLIVPVEGPNKTPVIAFFHADDTLDFYAMAQLDAGQGVNAGWVAVDSQLLLYSSPDDPANQLYVYEIKTGPQLRLQKIVTLVDENTLPMQFSGGFPQGGTFSPDGRLFYHSYGYFYIADVTNDGINVFETATWSRIRRSDQDDMPFRYNFSYTWGDEPEGLTVWDLTDCGAPGVGGELHVILLDNNWGYDDDVEIRHYADSLCVDQSFTGQSDWGKPHAPFKTVGEANDAAWDGARIKITAGSYPETLVFSKRLQVLSQGGVVRIGAP